MGCDYTFRLVEEMKDKDGVLKDSDIFEIPYLRILIKELATNPVGGMVETVGRNGQLYAVHRTLYPAGGPELQWSLGRALRLHGAEVEEVDGGILFL